MTATGLEIANLQWSESDYDQARLYHVRVGNEHSLERARRAWDELVRARIIVQDLALRAATGCGEFHAPA